MSVIDWESKPEPWRSIGLDFVANLAVFANPRPMLGVKRPDSMSGPTDGATPGGRIRNSRLLLGWPASMLAERADMGRSSITSYERGERNPPPKTRAKIADALGVEVSEIWP